MFAIALAAITVLVGASSAEARRANSAPRVITVSTHGGGGAHERITLSLDKAAIVQLDRNARDVLVSNPAIVDAVVRTPRRIFLLAQKVGQTNAFFFDGHGHQLLSIDIRVERDVTDLSNMFRKDMPGSKIKVSALNDNVVLTGSVENAQDSTRATDLAGRFVGDPKKVVNMLKIGGGEQVMLKVRIAEVQREVAKQLGVDVTSAMKVSGVPIIAATSNPYGLVGRALADMSGVQIGSVGPNPLNPTPNNVQGVMKALEKVGLVHTLAEPNLIAVSGETAKFLAGGEFPVPSGRDSSGNVSVQFKNFGVGLSFTPVVLSPNRISLQISTEVSELTNTGAFTIAGGTATNSNGQAVSTGLTIPALAVRRAETTVEVPSGGSFAIAGLLQHTSKQELDAFPGLKDMPVLGALFRSRDYQNNETELVVMVSAYLVSPVKGDKIALPTDGFVPANDAQTILMGQLNTPHKEHAPQVKSSGNATTGFIVQ
jgi:pilus assembly protein CpaC